MSITELKSKWITFRWKNFSERIRSKYSFGSEPCVYTRYAPPKFKNSKDVVLYLIKHDSHDEIKWSDIPEKLQNDRDVFYAAIGRYDNMYTRCPVKLNPSNFPPQFQKEAEVWKILAKLDAQTEQYNMKGMESSVPNAESKKYISVKDAIAKKLAERERIIDKKIELFPENNTEETKKAELETERKKLESLYIMTPIQQYVGNVQTLISERVGQILSLFGNSEQAQKEEILNVYLESVSTNMQELIHARTGKKVGKLNFNFGSRNNQKETTPTEMGA